MKRMLKTRGIFVAMLLAVLMAATLPMAAFAQTTDPYLNAYDVTYIAPIYALIEINSEDIYYFCLSPSIGVAGSPPSYFDSYDDALNVSFDVVLDSPQSLYTVESIDTDAMDVGTNDWVTIVQVTVSDNETFGSLSVKAANINQGAGSDAFTNVSLNRQEEDPWQYVYADQVELRVYDPIITTTYYSGTGTILNTAYYEPTPRSFPTAIDALYEAFDDGWISKNVDTLVNSDSGGAAYLYSMNVNDTTYASTGEKGWQYRVYRTVGRDMVPLSEFVDSGSIKLLDGDIVVWKYGIYGDPNLFPDPLP